MATKEDILEQIVEEYLVHKGYLVQHNIKFLPRKDHPEFVLNLDSNHSDVDAMNRPGIAGDNRFKSGGETRFCNRWMFGRLLKKASKRRLSRASIKRIGRLLELDAV